MRKNYETVLSGTRAVLVPYRREHVERYHEWMKSPFLLEMTGSEPLSFEEEVEMQLSWRDDDDKCTFILLNRERCESFLVSRGGGKPQSSEWPRSLENSFITNTLDSMVGDVNLFLSDEEVEDDENGEIDDCAASGVPRKQAELDLMVAEESSRGMGIGKEAACLMMLYGAQELGIRKFTVKIKEENFASRHLFEKSLGFNECNYAACFKEYEFVFQRTNISETITAIRKIYQGEMDSWKVTDSDNNPE